MKRKIKIVTPMDVVKLVSCCRSFDEDINLSCGHVVVDAKSDLGVLSIVEENNRGEDIEIEILSNNINSIDRFNKELKWIFEPV